MRRSAGRDLPGATRLSVRVTTESARANLGYMSALTPADQEDSAPPVLPVDRQITRQEAAARLKLSVGRVRQLYDSGVFSKYYNAQSHLRLDSNEVEAYRVQRETFRNAPAVKVPA